MVRGGFGYFYDRLTDGNYATTYFINNPVAAVVAKIRASKLFLVLCPALCADASWVEASLGKLCKWDKFKPGGIHPSGEFPDAVGRRVESEYSI